VIDVGALDRRARVARVAEAVVVGVALVEVRDARAVVEDVLDLIEVVVRASARVPRRDLGAGVREVIAAALGLAEPVVRAAVGGEHDGARVRRVPQPRIVAVLVDPEDGLGAEIGLPDDGHAVAGGPRAPDDVAASATAVLDEPHDVDARHGIVEDRLELGPVVDDVLAVARRPEGLGDDEGRLDGDAARRVAA
jgi:hypothetical protein